LLEDCDNKEVYELLHSFKNEPLEIIKSSFFEYIKTEKNRNINELANKVLKYLNNDDNSFNFDYNFELLVDILKNYGKITNTTEQSKIKLIIGSLDITDFDGDTISDGKFINIAYRNQLVNPEAQSTRGKGSGYATNSDPCFGIGDSSTSIGTFTPLWFPNGVCKETIPYFNCNSIYIGSGTTYPNPYTNVFGTHGKQGNNFYRRISVPTYTNSATPITLVTNGSNPTIFTGDLFNRLDLK
jgi:hypothetical protein